MPIVQIQLLEGRTDTQKEMMIAKVTDALIETMDVSAEQVRIIISEVSPRHWGVAGKSKAHLIK